MIEKKYLEREETRAIKKVQAIIVHWPGGDVVGIDALWKWMNEKSKNSYHFFVSKERTMHLRDLSLRAIHCGHSKYTEKAKDYFGERTCSNLDSPNNYTIGVCMLHDRENGSYEASTMETAVELLSALCYEYNLDPQAALLRHSDLTDEKRIPCPRGFFEEGEDPDDLWTEFKEWVREDLQNLSIQQRKRRELNL